MTALGLRRKVVGVVLLLVVVAGVGRAEPPRLHGIQGQDDRQPLDSVDWPWSAMGRVNQASQRTAGHCTGTLVAPSVVLTAAHCLYNAALKRPAKPHEIHFLAGYRRGEALAQGVGERFVLPGDYRPVEHPTVADAAGDWAFVVLKAPMTIRPVPLKALPAEQMATARLTRAGYSRDRAHMLGIHRGCALAGRLGDGTLLQHTCDGTHGDSGSALLAETAEGMAVIGINVGVIVEAKREIGNLAVSAERFAAAAREAGVR